MSSVECCMYVCRIDLKKRFKQFKIALHQLMTTLWDIFSLLQSEHDKWEMLRNCGYTLRISLMYNDCYPSPLFCP